MTLRKFTQLQSGFTLLTLTTSFTEGSGFTFLRFESWKGQEATESRMSDQQWFSTEEQAEQAMRTRATELKSLGWS